MDQTVIKKKKALWFRKGLFCILKLFFCLCLGSCTGNMLSVRSDYLSSETLASYYIGTPDPHLSYPPLGQRIIISWFLPKKYSRCSELFLWLTIRYKNREEIQKKIPVTRRFGTYLYYLLDKEYCDKGGIATYKIQLKNGNRLIEEWKHQLWAELILFENDTTER